MSGLVNVYRKDTGDKVQVPERWLAHRRLGEPFAKTPRQKDTDRKRSTTGKSSDDKGANDDA